MCSFSHALMRGLALECGYAVSTLDAVREATSILSSTGFIDGFTNRRDC